MGRHTKHKRKPHLCATCGEDRPEMFYSDRKSQCKRCSSADHLARYHARPRVAVMRPLVTRPRKPNDWTPEEIAAAAKFGLTVPQYREALRDV